MFRRLLNVSIRLSSCVFFHRQGRLPRRRGPFSNSDSKGAAPPWKTALLGYSRLCSHDTMPPASQLGTGVMKIIQFQEIFFCLDLFPISTICTGWFGIVGWVGIYPGVVATSTSLEIDGLTILHGAQPTIFRANSSRLRTNGTAAAREMVGWASYKLEGHRHKQALNQHRTPGFQPTHPTSRTRLHDTFRGTKIGR